jgi:hypothetical protein
MRKILVVVLFVMLNLVQHRVFAQSSYIVEPIPFLPFSFTQGEVLTLADDQYSGIIPLGFDFCFFGESYNEILVASNGYITFNLVNQGGYCPWSIGDSLPSPSVPDKAIMFPWQDLLPPSGGQISYFMFGEAPCRKFVVSYSEVAMFSCTNLFFSNQVVLYESSNIIETYIGNKPICPSWNNGNAVHGLSNDSSEAVVVAGRNYPDQWQAFDDAMRFIPLTCGEDTSSCGLLSDTPYTLITGRLFKDLNNDCIYNGNDQVLTSQLVTTDPGNYFDVTDNNGIYQLVVFETAAYQLEYNVPADMQLPQCALNTVSVTALGDTITRDIAIEPLECSDLSTYIPPTEFIPCDTLEIEIRLFNGGIEQTGSVELTVNIPIEFIVIGCNYNYTEDFNNHLTINLPNSIHVNTSDTVLITVVIPCDVSTGQFLCMDADGVTQTIDCLDYSGYDDRCTLVTTSIYSIQAEKIKIFPNPATTQLTITGYTPAYLTLCNTLGQTVAEATNTNTLWLGTLPQGLYLLQVFDAKGGLVKTEKVVKE